MSRYAATPFIVALSPGHSDITRFCPWLPIATGSHLDHAEKIPKVAQMPGTVDIFDPPFRHFGTHFAESFCTSKSSWMMDPTRSHEMPSCSAIDLSKIRRSSKINSWIWSIISGVVTVLGRPGWGASQVEKSRLNWATRFLTAYDGACFLMFLPEWREFLLAPCLAEKKKTWWQLASRCCWNLARRQTFFLSASVTRKDLQFGTWTDPSFGWHYRFHPTTSGSRLD